MASLMNLARSCGDFKSAQEQLAKVAADPYSDIERVSMAIDQADSKEALAAAADGMKKSAMLNGYEKFLYLVPRATAELAAGDVGHARKSAAEAVERATQALSLKSTDQLDEASVALAAALVAQRAGDAGVAEQAVEAVSSNEFLMKNRVPRELLAVVRSEQARIVGDTEKAIVLLAPYMDDASRFQTRVAAMEAYLAAGNTAKADEQARWLLARRGMAYAELQCGYCTQPLNVMDVSRLAKRQPSANGRVAAAVLP